MTNPARRLLGGHAFSTLTREEKKELYAAALDDQELFDALVEDESLREVLEDPAVRRELLAELEKPRLMDRVRAWFGQPATLAHLAVATAVVFVAFAGWVLVAPDPLRGVRGEGPAAASPGMDLRDPRAALFVLPPRVVIPARVEGEAPAFVLTVDASSRVLIAEKETGGRVQQVFPALGQGSAIGAGQAIRVTTSVKPGVHRVRFLVAPADVEPLSLDGQALLSLRGRLTVIERTYEVDEGGRVS
jgi:hypothetical protein